MYAKKNSGKKVVLTLLAIALLIGGVIGGTVAYLMASTPSVTNTFVVGNIGSLNLTETDDDGGANHRYTITPGVNIVKNPVVTYTPAAAAEGTTNVPVYVFVKVDVNDTWTVSDKNYSIAEGKITWSVAEGWTSLANTPGVFYKEITETTNVTTLDIMTALNNPEEGKEPQTIAVSDQITKNDVTTIAGGIGSISFTAYAIQKDGHDSVADAWTAVNP